MSNIVCMSVPLPVVSGNCELFANTCFLGLCAPVFALQVNGDCVRPSELPTAVLVELRSLLRAEQRVVSSSDAEVVKRSVDRCISVRQGCCVVKVTWCGLDVIASSTKSLHQALRWRAALTVLRNRAKARMSLGGCRHTLLFGSMSRTVSCLGSFQLGHRECRIRKLQHPTED